MAGHSAWKNIKHKKAAKDAKRGKAWTKCARAIIVAARAGGGDPDMNYALRAAVDDARADDAPQNHAHREPDRVFDDGLPRAPVRKEKLFDSLNHAIRAKGRNVLRCGA